MRHRCRNIKVDVEIQQTVSQNLCGDSYPQTKYSENATSKLVRQSEYYRVRKYIYLWFWKKRTSYNWGQDQHSSLVFQKKWIWKSYAEGPSIHLPKTYRPVWSRKNRELCYWLQPQPWESRSQPVKCYPIRRLFMTRLV